MCDLAAMTTPLRAAGVTVDMDPQECPHARLHDPEGNPIEPWEPQ